MCNTWYPWRQYFLFHVSLNSTCSTSCWPLNALPIDSSVGRAEDCSWSLMLESLGRWFKSGSMEWGFYLSHRGTYAHRYSGKRLCVGSGIRTHAHIRGPECSFTGKTCNLESGALDRSAIPTCSILDLVQILFPCERIMQHRPLMENRGIDPRTSRMLSERSTIWASSPCFGVRPNTGEITWFGAVRLSF